MLKILKLNNSFDVTRLRNLKEFDNHEMVIAVSDKTTNLKAYIGIHNTNLGSALGGTRLQVYQSDLEALKDVLNLSKAMSYKCALAGLPFGGGKAVIIYEDKNLDRDDLLRAYARVVDKLGGLFKTGTDMGVSDEDVKKMSSYTSHMLGVTLGDRGNLSTSKCAALGVFYSIKGAMTYLYQTEDLQDKKVAIKGVGKLGSELACLLVEAGSKVVVSDIDYKKCQTLINRFPTITAMPLKDIHRADVDVYAPCALGNELTPSVVKQLHCKAVVGGANNQLSSLEVGDQLHDQNILYAPDYIANGGGLIYVADELESDGFNKDRVLGRIASIQGTLIAIFERSKKESLPTYKIADTIAEERINSKKYDI